MKQHSTRLQTLAGVILVVVSLVVLISWLVVTTMASRADDRLHQRIQGAWIDEDKTEITQFLADRTMTSTSVPPQPEETGTASPKNDEIPEYVLPSPNLTLSIPLDRGARWFINDGYLHCLTRGPDHPIKIGPIQTKLPTTTGAQRYKILNCSDRMLELIAGNKTIRLLRVSVTSSDRRKSAP